MACRVMVPAACALAVATGGVAGRLRSCAAAEVPAPVPAALPGQGELGCSGPMLSSAFLTWSRGPERVLDGAGGEAHRAEGRCRHHAAARARTRPVRARSSTRSSPGRRVAPKSHAPSILEPKQRSWGITAYALSNR